MQAFVCLLTVGLTTHTEGLMVRSRDTRELATLYYQAIDVHQETATKVVAAAFGYHKWFRRKLLK